jgi:ribosome-binding factor A
MGAFNVKHRAKKEHGRRAHIRDAHGQADGERDPLAVKFFGGAGHSTGDRRDRRKGERHARQLCRQVYQALCYAMGDLADPVLRELCVHSVEPAPDATRLLVNLSAGVGDPVAAIPEIMERLQRVRPFLRQAVAAAITRKRAPELLFHIVPAGEVMP